MNNDNSGRAPCSKTRYVCYIVKVTRTARLKQRKYIIVICIKLISRLIEHTTGVCVCVVWLIGTRDVEKSVHAIRSQLRTQHSFLSRASRQRVWQWNKSQHFSSWSNSARSTGSSGRTLWPDFAWPRTRFTSNRRWKTIRTSSLCATSGRTWNVRRHLFRREYYTHTWCTSYRTTGIICTKVPGGFFVFHYTFFRGDKHFRNATDFDERFLL